MPKFEELSREELRAAVLDMQKGLSDMTKRLDVVSEENSLLREESALLKDAIDSRIEGGGRPDTDPRSGQGRSDD
eukprot:CAMPEP_0197652116 /NCGR_PEP_ID=MMETSP1338-20131121/34253_1 /TAXON_ID=43686 ORGANISM="Pelagodinium beii, Strain RCC1491" /NCGR_SAMPLE_ID=MMETSP1338 /ASSEMBLY_ACC=CAM_ASM_000754 /LENGTH=74 /DNA_ID=CAMNT_0043226917 /DNA_START=66 /DNA_END=290 /DNA_ORIENTATION=+